MSENLKTVVVIEDEPDAAEMFGEMMRVNGFRVVKSYTSGPAIDILDVMMPEVSGIDVLKMMRSKPGLSDIPVIVVSAKSMPADIKQGLEAGASVYLTKPVGFLDLKQAVENIFHGA